MAKLFLKGQSKHQDAGGLNFTSEPVLQFQGNVTTLVSPTANGSTQGVGLFREADCSMTEYFFGNYSQTAGTFSVSSVPNYQNFLHTAAQLKTTAGVYKNGCAQTMVGEGSRQVVYVGKTKSGDLIGAGIDYNNNFYLAVVNLNGTVVSESIQTSIQESNYFAVADLNGDGNNDLVVSAFGAGSAPSASGGIYVMLGNGDGTFQKPVLYEGGSEPGGFVIDDFNNDGKLDLLGTNGAGSGNGSSFVLLGNGDGTFQSPIAGPAGGFVVGVASGDLNNDGKKDVVFGGGAVFLGNGDGTFTAAGTLTASGIPILGDFNNDGKLDAAILSGNTTVNIELGNGDGTFSPGATYAGIYGGAFSISATDIDGDGNVDLIVGEGNSGALGPDLNTGGLFQVLMGNGDGTFVGSPAYGVTSFSSAVNVHNFTGFSGFATGDFNGDGKQDVLASVGNFGAGAIVVFPGDGKGNLTTGVVTSESAPGQIVTADIDGDKKLDAIYTDTVNGAYFVGVALGKGDGTFGAGTDYAIPGGGAGQYLAVGDFNGDGKPDVVVTAQTATYLLLNDGIGGLKAAQLIGSATNAGSVAAADLNGDGKLDLVVSDSGTAPSTFNYAQGSVLVYLGNGDSTFKTAVAYQPGFTIGGVAIADLNKDGKPDIAVDSQANGPGGNNVVSLSILPGKGDGTFGTAITTASQAAYGTNLAIADFDGDGNPDVLQGDCCGATFASIFLGNGDGTFSNNFAITTAVSVGQVGTADLNGDNKPDIVMSAVEGGSNGIQVYLNLYGSSTVPTTTPTTTALTISPNPATVGQSITFTAQVSPTSGSGVPTGAVTFANGSTTLGTGTLDGTGKATFSTSALTAATYTVTAAYPGDTNFEASTSTSVSLAVNAPVASSSTTVLTVSNANPTVGQNVTFTAKVTAPSGNATIPTGIVNFLNGTTQLGTGTLDGTGTATFSTTTLAAGTYLTTAVYVGDTNFTGSTSNEITVTVAAAPPPDFSISLNPTGGTVSSGKSVTSTVSITASNGFSDVVMVACSGAPKNATCSLSSTSIASGATSTLTIATGVAPVTTAAMRLRSLGGAAALAALLGLGLAPRRLRRYRRAVAMVVIALIFSAVALVGCGGSSHGTPSGSYTITVTGTDGALSHSATFNLKVQ